MNKATWTTNDGRKLEVMWMDSAHLVNAVNLLIRRNPQLGTREAIVSRFTNQRVSVWKEAVLRDLIVWVDDLLQLEVTAKRETLWELCLMHAQRQLDVPLLYTAQELEDTTNRPLAQRIIAKATELRLTK